MNTVVQFREIFRAEFLMLKILASISPASLSQVHKLRWNSAFNQLFFFRSRLKRRPLRLTFPAHQL
jgi:hypothetical protein